MRRFACAPAFQALASASAAALAVLVLFACGQQSGRPPQSAAPKGMIVGCSERSEADFPGAFSDPHNLVVGPLALVRGAEPTTASTIRRFGGQKFPLLLRAGH